MYYRITPSVAKYLIFILKAGRPTLKIFFKEVLKTKRLNTPLSIRHKLSVYALTYRHTICCVCFFLRAMDFLLHFAVQDRHIGPPDGNSAAAFQRGMQGHLRVYSFWEGSLNFKRPLIWPTNVKFKFYVYGSVHRWSTRIWIIVQRDATQSSLFIVICSFLGNSPASEF